MMFNIPEGYIQVTPYNNSMYVQPKEIKIYEEDKLIHCFVFVTDFDKFRVFDLVTGEFKRHRRNTKKKLFIRGEE